MSRRTNLILAYQWGPVRVFRNHGGRLEEWDPPVRLAEELGPAPAGEGAGAVRHGTAGPLSGWTGWWNEVAAGDFDGDGRLDLVVSNWGENTRYESFRQGPLHLFHGDAGEGRAHIAIEAYEASAPGNRAAAGPAARSARPRLLPLQAFGLMGMVLPEMRERVGGFAAYGREDLPGLYGSVWNSLEELQAVCLESMVFLNRGDHLEARPLPAAAQLAPAFAVTVADFDGDGREDLFLSQNLFALPADISRYDAGRGLWLRGDGTGRFRAIPATESGLKIYGEQRGAAAADFDGDGRTDLVVTQNGAETKLYRNTGGRPGLRVRLAGPPGNVCGIGATLRVSAAGRLGPAREVRGGSGYWSQDSAVQVLHVAEGQVPSEVQVRWPGGRITRTPVPAGARELVVSASGEGSVTP